MRLLAAEDFFAAHEALPWVALGWALYGLFLVFVTIAGRAKVTTRTLPAAAAGLAVNVVGLVVLVDPLGIAGAGIALCAAYVAMLVVVHVLTRRLFPVPFEWARLAPPSPSSAASPWPASCCCPPPGVGGFARRGARAGRAPAAAASPPAS